MLKTILKNINDTIFPVFCAECGEEGEWWCDACLLPRRFDVFSYCPVCGRPGAEKICFGSEHLSSLDGAFSLLIYAENDPAGKLIRDFKYNYARDIKTVWEKVAEKSNLGADFFTMAKIENGATVVPVPLYPRRERERGFNQAQIIGRIFYDHLQKNCPGGQLKFDDKNLIRFRPTEQQARLTKEERKKNVDGAFAWRAAAPLAGDVILVDDVFTSGATMQECARILKLNGAKKIIGLTLARAA